MWAQHAWAGRQVGTNGLPSDPTAFAQPSYLSIEQSTVATFWLGLAVLPVPPGVGA